MSIQKRWFLCAAALFAGLCPALALTGTPPSLANAVRSGDQFQFTIRGETNVSYIIESSTNLSTWAAAITNSDSQATRAVIVPATDAQGFWRVRPVPSPLFAYAILAQTNIQLGGTGRIDSFDSSNVLESGPNGLYDPSRATDRALVVTTSRAAGALSVGNMSIYGSVGTGPGGAVMLGANGIVGDIAYNNNPANRGTIQAGHFLNEFRGVLSPASLPRDFSVGPQMVLQNVTLSGGWRHELQIRDCCRWRLSHKFYCVGY
jgi:hypothetical protein